MKPLFISGLRAVGEEAVKAGVGALSDIGSKSGKEILRARLGEAGSNLKRRAEQKMERMAGAGMRTAKRPRIATNMIHVLPSTASSTAINMNGKRKRKIHRRKKNVQRKKKNKKKGKQRGGRRDVFS